MNWSPVFAGRVTPSFCYSKWLLHFGQYLCTPYTPMGRQTLLPPSFFPPIYSRIERFFFFSVFFLTLVKNQYDVLLFTLRRLWLFRADPLPRWREKIPFVCVCVYVDDCAEALWMAFVVLYCLTLFVVVVTTVALCECLRCCWSEEEEINVGSQWGMERGRVLSAAAAILCLVCLPDCWRLVPVGYWNGRQEKFVRYECRVVEMESWLVRGISANGDIEAE